MPRAALKPCVQPGCPVLHRGPGSRCPAHASKHEAQRQAWLDQHRPSSTLRGYDRAWSELRGLHLQYSPTCVECGKPATDVDHINPISTHPELRLAASNLRSLCHACHSRRTARDQGFARRQVAR